MYKPNRSLRILRIILAIRETSAPYNQFSLPWAEKHDISICSYFPSDITPSKAITLFEGDGSVRGFFRALRAALDAKDYDIIHVHSPHLGLMFLIATLFAYRRFAPSTILTVHDSYQNYKPRNRLMFIPVFALFQRIVCCGQASYDSFPAFYRWLAGKRLCAIPNGLDISRVDRIAASIEPQPQPLSEFTVTAISRLVEIKNPSTFLAAFQQNADPSSRLVYIGDGPLRDALRTQRSEAGMEDQIELTGLIPREKVFEYLLNTDLFVSTSRGEGLPVSVLEAMACNCPVVLSDIPPHREIAADLSDIPLVSPDDVAGFARAITKFRDMPKAERARIGRLCRKRVEERFSLSAMHAAYEDIYMQLADRPAPSRLEAQV